MDFRLINLCGASSISRVANVYEIQDFQGVPWSKYKIKVLERSKDFLAVPNVAVRTAEGAVEWISGIGRTEAEALQDAVSQISEALSARGIWRPEDFEWSDPHEF
jgi:hypothetical protein